MPYKDPIKKKAYYERHKKKYDAEWKNKNRKKWNRYQREYKRKINKSLWLKIKANPEKHKKASDAVRRYQNENRAMINKKDVEGAANLAERYVLKLLYAVEGLSRTAARENPELIEAKRILLKIKRSIYGN